MLFKKKVHGLVLLIEIIVYYELSHEHYKDLIYDFAERKRELYEKNLTYDEAIKAMFEGVEEYLSLKE